MGIFSRRSALEITSDRLKLRLPEVRDHLEWVAQRQQSEKFLRPWEPVRNEDQYSRAAFRNRVSWARQSLQQGRSVPLFLFSRREGHLLGAITLDNIRRGPSQAGTVGYWIGATHAQNGYMTEALQAVVRYAFTELDLSRIEAACLPENKASRAVLERTGFKYEGVAQSYLQIAGRWRTHVLYANLRMDRRGRTDAS